MWVPHLASNKHCGKHRWTQSYQCLSRASLKLSPWGGCSGECAWFHQRWLGTLPAIHQSHNRVMAKGRSKKIVAQWGQKNRFKAGSNPALNWQHLHISPHIAVPKKAPHQPSSGEQQSDMKISFTSTHCVRVTIKRVIILKTAGSQIKPRTLDDILDMSNEFLLCTKKKYLFWSQSPRYSPDLYRIPTNLADHSPCSLTSFIYMFA